MTQFRFKAVRSTEKAHQAVDVRCSTFELSGQIDGPSVNAVYAIVQRMLVIPGVWNVRVRNADPACEWKSFVPIDTRSPEQIPVAQKSRKPSL